MILGCTRGNTILIRGHIERDRQGGGAHRCSGRYTLLLLCPVCQHLHRNKKSLLHLLPDLWRGISRSGGSNIHTLGTMALSLRWHMGMCQHIWQVLPQFYHLQTQLQLQRSMPSLSQLCRLSLVGGSLPGGPSSTFATRHFLDPFSQPRSLLVLVAGVVCRVVVVVPIGQIRGNGDDEWWTCGNSKSAFFFAFWVSWWKRGKKRLKLQGHIFVLLVCELRDVLSCNNLVVHLSCGLENYCN